MIKRAATVRQQPLSECHQPQGKKVKQWLDLPVKRRS
jgi:hypothetical protein